jgi:hypothetical protein
MRETGFVLCTSRISTSAVIVSLMNTGLVKRQRVSRKTVPGPGRSIATIAFSRPPVRPPWTISFLKRLAAANSGSTCSGL